MNSTRVSGMFSGGGYFMSGVKSHAVSTQSVNRELKMKVRQPGQVTVEDVQARDLRKELEERETANFNSLRRQRESMKGGGDGSKSGGGALFSLEDRAHSSVLKAPEDDILAAFNDDDDDEPLLKANEALGERIEGRGGASASASNGSGGGGREEEEEEENDDDDDDDDDEEDDAEELRQELERLRKEKEAEKQRRQREVESLVERQQRETATKNNPLLVGHLGEGGGSGSTNFKRNFGDDTVFSNTHSGEAERSKKARFINDAVRSDFHRRFLARFIL